MSSVNLCSYPKKFLPEFTLSCIEGVETTGNAEFMRSGCANQ